MNLKKIVAEGIAKLKRNGNKISRVGAGCQKSFKQGIREGKAQLRAQKAKNSRLLKEGKQLLMEAEPECCTDRYYNHDCCEAILCACCDEEIDCCEDGYEDCDEGGRVTIRRDDDVRGFSGMVKKPPYGGGTGPTSGDRPPMG